jgi:hypothetical protein
MVSKDITAKDIVFEETTPALIKLSTSFYNGDTRLVKTESDNACVKERLCVKESIDPTRTAVGNSTRMLALQLDDSRTASRSGYQCSDGGGGRRACGDADDAVDGRRHARGCSNRS